MESKDSQEINFINEEKSTERFEKIFVLSMLSMWIPAIIYPMVDNTRFSYVTNNPASCFSWAAFCFALLLLPVIAFCVDHIRRDARDGNTDAQALWMADAAIAIPGSYLLSLVMYWGVIGIIGAIGFLKALF